MDNRKRSIAGRLTFGMLIICVGITLLLNNIGYVDWGVWNSLVSYWPVLLIIAGINVLFERSAARPITYITPFIVAGVFAFVILNHETPASIEVSDDHSKPYLYKPNTKYDSTMKVTGYEPTEVDNVKLEVNGGAGMISIANWSEHAIGEVVNVKAETTGFVPKLKDKLDNKVLKIELSDDKLSAFRTRGHEYIIEISPDYLFDLVINTGAGDMNFDLAKSSVGSLQINSGAAEISLIVPSKGKNECEIEINSGAAEIKIEVPKGVKVKVKKNGLGVIDSDDLEESNDAYSNPNDAGETILTVDIEINSAVGAVSLKPYKEPSSTGRASAENDSDVKTDQKTDEVSENGDVKPHSTAEDTPSTNEDVTDNERLRQTWMDSLLRSA